MNQMLEGGKVQFVGVAVLYLVKETIQKDHGHKNRNHQENVLGSVHS